jgi:hypothetical protein
MQRENPRKYTKNVVILWVLGSVDAEQHLVETNSTEDQPMTGKLLRVFATAVTLLVVSIPMFAHHGTAAYDTKNPVTLKATMTDFQFVNPHVQLYFDVKNEKGEVEHWQGELTAPNKLARAGWTKRTLKPGDEITVTGSAGKNGAHSIWINKLIGPTGESLPLFEE